MICRWDTGTPSARRLPCVRLPARAQEVLIQQTVNTLLANTWGETLIPYKPELGKERLRSAPLWQGLFVFN